MTRRHISSSAFGAMRLPLAPADLRAAAAASRLTVAGDLASPLSLAVSGLEAPARARFEAWRASSFGR